MRLFLFTLLPLVLSSALTTTITLTVPPTHNLPNPRTLPPSTHATLSSLYVAASAPLTTANTLVFRNVSTGSYLVDVHCATHAFAPMRVDVVEQIVGAGAAAVAGELKVLAWETYRGNDWNNKGEAVRLSGGALEVKLLGAKNYFIERSKFNVLSILKNPMILLGLVSMGIFFGMPYLVDNMDPEMREEWEKNQKSSTMNNLLGGGGGAQPAANPMSNFDMAAFLAGSNKKDDANAAPAASPAPAGNGGSGGKKEKGSRR